MSDYTDLVEYLREMHDVMLYDDSVESGIPEEMITDIDAIACKEAADAIEQLVKERDAAVADLKGLHDALEGRGLCCYACKNDVFDYDKSVCAGCALQDNWEWRGVREDNNETN